MSATATPRLVQAIMDRAAEPRNPSPFDSEAGGMYQFHVASQVAAGFRGEQPVVWVNVFFPYELCYALDIIPLSFEVMGGLTAGLELDDVLPAADDRYPARDTCTFLRAGLGGGLLELFPRPAALFCTSHLCEGAPKVAHALAHEWDTRYVLLDIPERPTPEGEAYVMHQLREVVAELERIAGRKLDPERLAAAFEHSNRAAAALNAVKALRQTPPAPIFGSPYLGLRLYLPWGHEVGAQITETLLREASAHAEAGGILPGGEAFRLLWLHLRPYYLTDLFNLVEYERRAVIVYNNFMEAYWEPLDPGDPYRSLARKILSNPDLLPADEAAQLYVREGLAHQVDGVVQFSHWGCRWNAGRYRILKDAFAAEGIPFLNVDGDGVDAHAASAGQLRTRLESFLEILEGLRE